ncbi:hypothetical protein JX265_003114 [Neoarthrinium moseri]|uniref:NAD(P)-binding protein n=1 Tax=Neoarthrinium moseri TaxID=1658444 RepID=A0A9Q0ATS8_9PEZI|nr:hypothetical protein JX265_003114 [Neoarthrinium moseri]
MATNFDISPEKEATFMQFFYRQFFVTPSPVTDVDLREKLAVVTGSNGGIGLECCRQLLALGLSKLILAVRDKSKGHVWELDMSSYDSIGAFVERAQSLERLDILILNAGITGLHFTTNPSTGHENNVQINYISTALLAIQILPVLKSKIAAQQQPSRMVIVSTDASAWTSFPEQESDPLLPSFDVPGKIDMTTRYYTSRLLGQFFLLDLAKRVPSSVAVINAATPGLVYGTASQRDIQGTFEGRIKKFATRIMGYSPEVGARQITYAALKYDRAIHGQYLCSQKVKPMAPIIYTSKGQQISERLWRETMMELSFANVEQILDELRQ